MTESNYRLKLIVLDIIERMNDWEEVTICVDQNGYTLYEGLNNEVPPDILNSEVTGIGVAYETVLIYINT